MEINTYWRKARQDGDVTKVYQRDINKVIREYKAKLGVYGTLKVLRNRRDNPSCQARRRAKDRSATVRFKRSQDIKTRKTRGG